MERRWRQRNGERLPDSVWEATVRRVRGEFQEMPCLRLSLEQASALFGLRGRVCEWVLTRLQCDGFLDRTPKGEYVRR